MVIVKALQKRKTLKRLSVDDNKYAIIHNKVIKNALIAYREMFTKLLEERGLKSNNLERIDIEAAIRLRDQKLCVNMVKRLGSVPGIEVGDEFHNRAELTIVGLHHCFQNDIDYVKKGGKILAVSIVNSGRYANRVESPDTLIYSGAGGNPSVDTAKPKDQLLKRGNLALMNSMEHGNYVRVIRAVNRLEVGALRKKNSFTTYVYDGLYTVEDCKRERGSCGKLVFKFYLKRIPEQPEISWGKVSGKPKRPIAAKNIVWKNDI